MPLFRFAGSLLFRFAERQFEALLFQQPPRITREEALRLVPQFVQNSRQKRTRAGALDKSGRRR